MKMKKSLIILLVIGAIVLIGIFSSVGSYNALVSSETEVENKFSAIDVQLQRRSDLIPNIVNTVKGYTTHEAAVLKSIADARSKLAGATTPSETAAADTQLTGALSRLLVVVENYPNLKADTQFTKLTDELAGTENRISVARRDYNEVVTTYNVKIRTFPTALFASMLGFEKKPFFKGSEGSDKVPEVKF